MVLFLGENSIMNKRVVVAALALAAISVFAQETVKKNFLWEGATDTQGKVETGSPDSTAGYWYEYTDENDQGTSKFTWPADVEANDYNNFFGPLIEAYAGIKGSFTLGDGYEYPYAGIGFNVLSDKQEGADITAWEGICLAYESTIGFGIELGVENEKEVTAYDNYKATVGKSPTSTIADYAWNKFKQGKWGTVVDQDVVLKATAAIKLKFEGTAGTSGDFRICQIGSLGRCTGCGSCCGFSYDSSVKAAAASSVKAAAASSVKAQLSDRVLYIQGISSAKAEVINLQGEVVKSATVSSTMDLSGLDAGIYMVRVAGKSVNFAQKIVLK